jgi:hypothetical protein
MLDGHIRSTTERIKKDDCVLLIQDTTNLDFAHHPSTKGLGHLDNLAQYGMKLHTTLAVSTAGVPLGLVDHPMWARAPETFKPAQATAEKERQRWLTRLERAQQRVPETVTVVTIADSEADIFDLFALPRREGSHIDSCDASSPGRDGKPPIFDKGRWLVNTCWNCGGRKMCQHDKRA